MQITAPQMHFAKKNIQKEKQLQTREVFSSCSLIFFLLHWYIALHSLSEYQ